MADLELRASTNGNNMTKWRHASAIACLFFAVGCAQEADLAITNARIVVGDGNVIENGSVVIVDGRLFSIEPGKIADIVIVNGNPLEDLSALGNIALVIQAGEITVQT